MIWGEHLCADEVAVQCPCGIAATVEVVDERGRSHGWFCQEHACRVRQELRRQEKIARAIVTKGAPR